MRAGFRPRSWEAVDCRWVLDFSLRRESGSLSLMRCAGLCSVFTACLDAGGAHPAALFRITDQSGEVLFSRLKLLLFPAGRLPAG